MNTHEQQLKALGDFIKSRRAQLTPSRMGLPPGYNRRRTPGLRREEVAQLAGVSVTWYTWLEQGRDINVSKQVLDSISRVLRLNDDEYIHMLNLAQIPVQPSATAKQTAISAGLQKIIDALAYPALVLNTRADVLAWNTAASTFFVDFSSVPEKERNMIWQWFTNTLMQSRIAAWEELSQYVVAVFRGFCDRSAGDPWFSQFIDELMQVSPLFRELWTLHNVRQKSANVIALLSPTKDKESFEVTSFQQINGKDDINFFVFTPSST